MLTEKSTQALAATETTATKLEAIAKKLDGMSTAGRVARSAGQFVENKSLGLIPTGSNEIAKLQTELGDALNDYDKSKGGVRGAGSIPYREVQKEVMGSMTTPRTAEKLRTLAAQMRKAAQDEKSALVQEGYNVRSGGTSTAPRIPLSGGASIELK